MQLLNKEQEDEHFAMRSAGCASQRKSDRIIKLETQNYFNYKVYEP
jgi:hypothetical protein